MLTARRAILGLALLLAMIGDSSGQPPPEPPRQNPGGAQQRTNTEQPDTDKAPPSIIKKIPADQTQQKPTDREQNGPENRSDAWTLSDKIAVVASIAAMLQFVALVVTVCVFMRTAKRQLRAYMGGAAVQDENIYAPQFLAQMVIKNSGQTPAYDVCAGCKMSAYDNPLPDGFIFEAVPYRLGGPRYIVNPDSNHAIFVEAKPPLTPEDKVAIKEGKKCLYLWGEIRYRDAFAKYRFAKYKRTRFRLVWLREGNPGMWKYCDDGNEAT